MTPTDPQAIADLATSLSGPLLDPETHGYETARQVHNGMIDRRPALIARCTGIADIVDAVNFGRDHGLEIAVKGGGHNVAGNATTDGGLMIDLSLMKGAAVDPVNQTVHAQGGLTWGEFNRETQAFGLATTGGVISTTGIAGLTLGGGLGWLMGTHGMTVDNLRSVQIVTADGQIRTASETENPDLFWAVRGGGGNFGVVSTFEYQLHPVDGVTAGVLVWPIDAARDLLHFYRDFVTHAPRRPRRLLRHDPAPRRLRHPGRRDRPLPLRRPCCRQRSAATPLRLRTAHRRCGRPHLLQRPPHDVRRRLPPRRTQLLEVQLPQRPPRRRHRHPRRPVRRVGPHR